MVGRGIARSGFGLVVGDWPGVDAAAAEGFNVEFARDTDPIQERFLQLQDSAWRKHVLPGRRYKAEAASITKAATDDKLQFNSVAKCDALVLIGGHVGALRTAQQFMSAGKPVFPIPFSGGRSNEVFQELLKTWHDNPIPGLTRNQLLQLALPWLGNADSLMELLRGTLADYPEIFISYRRTDSGSAVGRLHRDLADHFGGKRIFLDETRIEPSAAWKQSIHAALEKCRIGLVVIGRNWMSDRLQDPDDILRHEVSSLLQNKQVLPVLVDDAGMPSTEALPKELERLTSIQSRSIGNANWDFVMLDLIRTIESSLRRRSLS
jgi:hypothetical protein